MKTLNVSISESEYKMLGIKTEKLTFSDVVDLVTRQQFRKKLKKSIGLAEKAGLSIMTMDEITEEASAVRNAKNRH